MSNFGSSIVDTFDHFTVEYKILTWIVYTLSAALAFGCVLLFLYQYNVYPPKPSNLSTPEKVYAYLHSTKYRGLTDHYLGYFDGFDGVVNLLTNVLNAISTTSWMPNE